MRVSLFVVALLVVVSSAQAQHSHSHCASGFGGGGGINWSLGGQLGGTTISGSEFALQHEPPREFGVVAARNDGEFIPSTFMKYEDALELGKQQIALAEQRKKDVRSVSLGEVARSYRASKELKLEARLIQGDSHNLEVCDLRSFNCRLL